MTDYFYLQEAIDSATNIKNKCLIFRIEKSLGGDETYQKYILTTAKNWSDNIKLIQDKAQFIGHKTCVHQVVLADSRHKLVLDFDLDCHGKLNIKNIHKELENNAYKFSEILMEIICEAYKDYPELPSSVVGEEEMMSWDSFVKLHCDWCYEDKLKLPKKYTEYKKQYHSTSHNEKIRKWLDSGNLLMATSHSSSKASVNIVLNLTLPHFAFSKFFVEYAKTKARNILPSEFIDSIDMGMYPNGSKSLRLINYSKLKENRPKILVTDHKPEDFFLYSVNKNTIHLSLTDEERYKTPKAKKKYDKSGKRIYTFKKKSVIPVDFKKKNFVDFRNSLPISKLKIYMPESMPKEQEAPHKKINITDPQLRVLLEKVKNKVPGITSLKHLPDKNIIIAKRTESGPCPYCLRDHLDGNRDGFIYEKDGMYLFRCCKVDSTGKRPVEIAPCLMAREKAVTVVKKERMREEKLSKFKNELLGELPQEVQYLTDSVKSNSRGIKPYDISNATTIIKANMGMGKSKALQKALTDDSGELYGRTVFITHVRSVLYQIANKYGLPTVDDANADAAAGHWGGSIVTTLDSCWKLKDIGSICFLVFDEIESIVARNDCNMLKHTNKVENMFNVLLKHVPHFIAIDSEIDDLTVDIIKKMRFKGATTKIYHNAYKSWANKTVEVTTSKPDFLGKIMDALKQDKKIAVFSCSKSEMYALAKQISQTFAAEGKFTSKGHNSYEDMFLYSADTDADLKAKHFADVNKVWTKSKIVMATSTLTSGVSYELPGFDIVFGNYHQIYHTIVPLQSLGRIRDCNNICLLLPLNLKKETQCSIESIESQLEANTEFRNDIPNLTAISSTIVDGELKLKFNKDSNYYCKVYNCFKRIQSKVCGTWVILSRLAQMGCKIEYIATAKKGLAERVKFAMENNKEKKNIKLQQATDVAKAFTDKDGAFWDGDVEEEAQALLKLQRQGKKLNLEDNTKLQKYFFGKYYGVANKDITPTMIQKLDNPEAKLIYRWQSLLFHFPRSRVLKLIASKTNIWNTIEFGKLASAHLDKIDGFALNKFIGLFWVLELFNLSDIWDTKVLTKEDMIDAADKTTITDLKRIMESISTTRYRSKFVSSNSIISCANKILRLFGCRLTLANKKYKLKHKYDFPALKIKHLDSMKITEIEAICKEEEDDKMVNDIMHESMEESVDESYEVQVFSDPQLSADEEDDIEFVITDADIEACN